MRKVVVYSGLLIAGLLASQFLDGRGEHVIRLLTMFALAFIMIHVGYEFELDKSRPGDYAWDYVVAATAATFPWIFCALYFVYVMSPPELWRSYDLWKEALLEARFASPTSAGVLFSMLAAAGLGASWLFGKARVLAIFDDLDTILLMIPLKIMMVGFKWQLGAIVLVIGALLALAWKYLHVVRLPVSWLFVMTYSAAITAVCEAIYLASTVVDDTVPIHLEVLLPAFVLGCVLARPPGHDPHRDDAIEGHEQGPESPVEQRVATVVSACFMILVGLSMPAIGFAPAPPASGPALGLPAGVSVPAVDLALEIEPMKPNYAGVSAEVIARKQSFPGWGTIALHVLFITLLSNLGKMFPALCYRTEAGLRERLALAIAMFPRGEVGAGVLVVSLSYGLAGPALTVAVLSLALNLLLTGVFIVAVKRLIGYRQVEAVTGRLGR
jgi:Kef-type K+ transport system membrane component KefB